MPCTTFRRCGLGLENDNRSGASGARMAGIYVHEGADKARTERTRPDLKQKRKKHAFCSLFFCPVLSALSVLCPLLHERRCRSARSVRASHSTCSRASSTISAPSNGRQTVTPA